MFLGPVEAAKPWDTNGIDGCHRFLKKFWNLFWERGNENKLIIDDVEPSNESLKSVHRLIKKVSEDIERFSYNTSVSAFMIAVNELGQQKCHNRRLLQTMVVLLAPFAPHIAEELWHVLTRNISWKATCSSPLASTERPVIRRHLRQIPTMPPSKKK